MKERIEEEQPAPPAPEPAAPPARRWGPGQTFSALHYPNFKLWFIGQLISLFGTWMQITAETYLAFELTHSPAYLGYVGFASGLPMWVLMLYGGVVADRMSRRTLLVLTQSAMMLLAIAATLLVGFYLIQPWHLIVLSFLLGIANAFDAPARQSFVLEMVGREALTNAVALNSTLYNLASAVGPAIAGITYAAFGPTWCFILNAISFLGVIIALLMMKLEPHKAAPRVGSGMDQLKEGFGYITAHPIISTLIIMVAVSSIFGLAYYTLIPAWAVTILGGDARTSGALFSARGLGALIGALLIATLGQFKFKGRLLMIGHLVFPLFLIAFAFARWVPLSLVLLVGAGWGFMVMLNLANVLLQTTTPDNLRGRVMSFYSLMIMGLFPIGALLSGLGGEWIGEPALIIITALISLAFGLWLWFRVPQIGRLE